MQVKNHLTRIWTAVGNQTVSGLIYTFLDCNDAGNQKQMTGKQFIGFCQVIDRCNMPVWNDQHVGGCNRVNIPECGNLLVLVQNLSRGFSGYDFTKDAIVQNNLRIQLNI